MSRILVGVDTNVFVYAIDIQAPEHQAAQRWLEEAGKRKFEAVVSSQNLVELYAVLTNKKQMGEKVLSMRETLGHVENILEKGVFEIVFPVEGTVTLFRELVRQVKPVGQAVHDVFLGATLLSNGVNRLLTADAEGFNKIRGLRVVDLA